MLGFWSKPSFLSVAFAVSLGVSACSGDEAPPVLDYCKKLEQEIQGKKHGFLAGNVSYYVGGFHASWRPVEDETIGLTHPFCHDLRSRGVGLLESELEGSEHTGIGNDFSGWEFYKDTRVLYGSVVINGEVHEHPKPARMYWRPDKMVCEYVVDGVEIREEKFIGPNDAAASIITSSEPIVLRFSGHSFFVRNSVTSTAQIENRKRQNIILITEGGTVKSRPDPNGPERVGPIVYQGMTTALSASRNISETIEFSDGDRGEKHYQFEVPCDAKGVTVSWAMHDEPEHAVEAARAIIDHDEAWLRGKTAEMNQLLSRGIPQFRCSDSRFENIYYYLWALHLMYYIDVEKGWEMESHTQTAVNNFLGIHRYDACFQIKVGAWAANKAKYAYGNVLTWKHLVEHERYRKLPNGAILLSDNKGTTWHSGAYGGELSEHVLGAWQIYEHTGDVEFLHHCYEGYFRKVFWNSVTPFAMNQFEVADKLEAMARLTGNSEDVEHWQGLVRRDSEHVRLMFDQRWEANGHADYFMGGSDGMLMTNAFWAMRSKHFPREYAVDMVKTWALDGEKGFRGEIFPRAMSAQSMKKFATPVDHSFGYTPDTAYFTLDGMFSQGLAGVASELTLDHLSKYNFHEEWGVPVAPEAYQRDMELFGDQYSNFNAGKILLFIEGLAGVSYSVPDQTFRVRDALPESWEWMELEVPTQTATGGETLWTNVRIERSGKTKSVFIENSPFDVILELWLENRQIIGKPDLVGSEFVELESSQPGRVSFRITPKAKQASISLKLQ